MARSQSRLALSDACVGSRLSRCRAGAAITGVGTLPMRTVSRHAYGSKCPSVNPNVFNIGHTAPVDQRLPLAATLCVILYHGVVHTSKNYNSVSSNYTLSSSSILPLTYVMMELRPYAEAEPQAGR